MKITLLQKIIKKQSNSIMITIIPSQNNLISYNQTDYLKNSTQKNFWYKITMKFHIVNQSIKICNIITLIIINFYPYNQTDMQYPQNLHLILAEAFLIQLNLKLLQYFTKQPLDWLDISKIQIKIIQLDQTKEILRFYKLHFKSELTFIELIVPSLIVLLMMIINIQIFNNSFLIINKLENKLNNKSIITK
ncbi:unnamed protein product [Paramecium pentaurelia]|uniref:Transmembrane protein n=1 Tax=Paramecium pentaurelia TaxID=43138 RepID=A0A8S1TFN3_9CILI|nr:unnamed protein product [Paramecium pentaurelia]